MALDAIALKLVAPHLAGATVLCLGYPDLVMEPSIVGAILKIQPRLFTEHGAAHKLKYGLAETCESFRQAGAVQVTCVDIKPSRGCERVLDLNVAQSWDRLFSLVIDAGTIEHCFNVGQAFANAWSAVEVGGVIVHVSPLSMQNHGFFNVCPTAYNDFYQANSGDLIAMQAATRTGQDVPISLTKRFAVDGEAVVCCAVRKTSNTPIVWPTQFKYQ